MSDAARRRPARNDSLPGVQRLESRRGLEDAAILHRGVGREDHVEHVARLLGGEDGRLLAKEARDEVPRAHLDRAERVPRDLDVLRPAFAGSVGLVVLVDAHGRIELP